MMSSIKKNFIYNSIYQILLLLIPIITTPYISRVLGATNIGVYSFNNSIAYYFVIFTMLGLNNYGNREIAKSKGNKEKLSSVFWNIYSMQVGCGVIVNICYAIYVFFIAENKTIAFILWIYVVSASFDINWFFFGLEKFKLTVTRNIIVKICTTVSVFLFVKTSDDVGLYCLVLSLGYFVSHLALWPFVSKEVIFSKIEWNKIREHIKPNLFLFITVLAVSLFKIMDKIMLGIITTEEEVGFYESSERIIQIPIAFITSLGTVMLPRMSSLIANNRKEGNMLTYKSIIFAMFLSSSISFGLMGISREFVPMFYGPGYDTCVYLFWILLPSSLFMAFANVIRTQYLIPIGNDKIYVISAILGAVFNLTINFLLIPILGAIGASIGTLISELVVCVYQSFMSRKGIPIKKYIVDAIPFIASGVVMFFILICIEFETSLILNVILKVCIGVMIYFVSLLLLLSFTNKKLLTDVKYILKIRN